MVALSAPTLGGEGPSRVEQCAGDQERGGVLHQLCHLHEANPDANANPNNPLPDPNPNPVYEL